MSASPRPTSAKRSLFNEPVALGSGLWGGLRNGSQRATATLVLFAVSIGIGAGFGAVLFRKMLTLFHVLAFGITGNALSFLGAWSVIFAPILGGLLVGPIVYFFAREAKGHGVPEVIAAIALHGGRIRPRVVVIKALASALCIGSGGSAGREGPIVQIGAAFGSTIGQLLHLPEERIRLFLACGAAGGISATFNAPIAGVFFALEVILDEFETRAFSMIVIASVVADVIGRKFLGDHPSFEVPHYQFVSPLELIPYAILGLLCGLAAITFSRMLYGMEDLWDHWHIPEYLKPASGGILMGLIGLLAYQFQPPSPAGPSDSYLFGVGYNGIEPALFSQLPLVVLLLFFVLKLFATSVTLGSGGSGGVFSPSLFLGAMLGGAFGTLVHGAFPTWSAHPGAYAMVGMGAVFAGAAQAPITSVLIIFEMTDNYTVILPLMTAVVLATLLAQRLSPNNIYLLKLVRRGIQARQPKVTDILETITVGEIMTTSVTTIAGTTSLEDAAALFQSSGHHGFPVINQAGELAGIVTLSDIERAADIAPEGATVADVMTKQIITAYPDQSVASAVQQLGAQDVGRIPVVDRQQPRHLAGLLRRADIINAYHRALTTHRTTQTRVARLQTASDARFLSYTAVSGSLADGRRVRDLHLPATSVLVSITRQGRTLIPRGDVRIASGDAVLLFVTADDEQPIAQVFTVPVPSPPPGPDEVEAEAGIAAPHDVVMASSEDRDPPPDHEVVKESAGEDGRESEQESCQRGHRTGQ
ncbi:MAG: chloride channel protein [Chloroflexi bacterium]|nr:chloride channel protein [Chloroflexota bacterium]